MDCVAEQPQSCAPLRCVGASTGTAHPASQHTHKHSTHSHLEGDVHSPLAIPIGPHGLPAVLEGVAVQAYPDAAPPVCSTGAVQVQCRASVVFGLAGRQPGCQGQVGGLVDSCRGRLARAADLRCTAGSRLTCSKAFDIRHQIPHPCSTQQSRAHQQADCRRARVRRGQQHLGSGSSWAPAGHQQGGTAGRGQEQGTHLWPE